MSDVGTRKSEVETPNTIRDSSFTRYNKTMHPPSRVRRFFKWTGVGVCASILVVWHSGLEIAIPVGPRGYMITMANFGLVGVQDHRDREVPFFEVRKYSQHPHMQNADLTWPHVFVGGSHNKKELAVPFWIAFVTVAIPTAWLWHHGRRRVLPGHCARCGYDLTGNTSGTCSECGERRLNAAGIDASGSIEANG